MSQPIPAFDGEVANGKLTIRNRERFDAYLTTLDGPVRVVVSKRKKNRSDNANRYYWGCVVKIAGDHFGYVAEETHDAFKYLFLRREEPGKPVTLGSTARMSVGEFYEYVEGCRRWCAEQGLVIPDPLSYYEANEYG
jgi:hypothetical protein